MCLTLSNAFSDWMSVSYLYEHTNSIGERMFCHLWGVGVGFFELGYSW